jgi:putative ABC transport system ATP-binding protein
MSTPGPEGGTAVAPIVRLEHVSKVYGASGLAVQALADVTLELPAGEFIVILGPSGSGKTTLLNILGGIDKVTDGTVVVDGRTVSAMSDSQLTEYRRHVGFVFQFFNLIPTLTAQENVELAAELSSRPRDALEVLGEVGLRDRAQHFPSQLSGGEQQRVAIARALVTDPPLVLCDEPTGNLDEDTGKAVLAYMKELGARRQKTFVVVTHNSVIARLADRVVRLRDHKIASVEANDSPLAASELSW